MSMCLPPTKKEEKKKKENSELQVAEHNLFWSPSRFSSELELVAS